MSKSFVLYIPECVDSVNLFKSIIEANRSEYGTFSNDSVSEIQLSSESEWAIVKLVDNPLDYIQESQSCDYVDLETRDMLTHTVVISIEYNSDHLARRLMSDFIKFLGDQNGLSVLDNDFGVLLKMGDVKNCIETIRQWTWRKESFPEIPGCPHVE